MRRLNGWQRIGVILSVLWGMFIAVLAYKYFGIIDPYNPPLLYYFSEFLGLPYMGLLHKFVVLLAAFVLPVIGGWLLIYIFVWCIKWVMAGFKSWDNDMKIDKKVLSLIVAFCFVAVITVVVLISECLQNEIINWGLFVATVSLATIAYIQLKALREQANADFLLKFNREFFGNETNQKIIIAIEEHRNVLEENKGEFTEYDLDDYLGYYELMSWYEKRGFIDFELIDEMFGHYISMAWQNEEIKKYIDDLRAETKDPRYYKPFENLADSIIEKEKEIRNAAI